MESIGRMPTIRQTPAPRLLPHSFEFQSLYLVRTAATGEFWTL